ncbi:Complement C3 [Liparis tanakae]|uniref:Complement C3 n=1 Tax=Liparis tanakae TaxID=230148 RepID=A0A4Z2EZQ9_9TELE|nr:Complement C3 [Liparis tanakae]
MNLINRLASKNVDHPLPDSITEWGILAISASPHTGFCVAEPYNVRAWRRFFVDLKLPYSVARNEQVQIKAVVHNYGDDDLHVRVVLMKTEGMCSIAFKGKHTQEVSLPAGSSVTVPYTIVPLVVGKLPVEVMVVGKDMTGGDRVQKHLRVVLDGVQKTNVFSAELNPSAEGGTQTVRVGKIELKSVVPNSVPETFINVRGNVLADSIDNSLSEDSLASLIRMPGGCVEQNLASISLPLIATLYLERTNNWESVGVERKAEALRYIKRGYENQLAYRKSDGSYPPYRKEGAICLIARITAYVVKVFSMAYSLVGIEEQRVCEPLIYLVTKKHEHRGNFVESNPVYSTTMTGGLRGDDPETTLTAFVLIALAEAKRAGISCSGPDVEVRPTSLTGGGAIVVIPIPSVVVLHNMLLHMRLLQEVIRKTAEYLKRALATAGRRPYAVAIASYALALLGKDRPYDPTPSLLRAAAPGSSACFLYLDEASRRSAAASLHCTALCRRSAAPSNQTRGSHWPDTHNTLFSLEATGYALLALVHLGRLEAAAAPFKWLNSQRRRGGGFGSTQSTMVVLQALSEYLVHKPPPADLHLDVDVKMTGRRDVRYHFNPHTAYMARSSRLPANLDLEVEARGNGRGILEVVTHYNQLHEVDEKTPCKDFELNVAIEESSETPPADVVKSYQITIKASPELSDLEKVTGLDTGEGSIRLSNSVDSYISNFQVVDNLSDRGSLIVHLFKVSHKEPEILIFRLQQSFRVGLLQPSSVTVYEYYNPGDCCVSRSDSENFLNKERETFACMNLHHVFQVKVLSVSQSYYDKYELEITQVFKLGVEAGVEVGHRRLFMSHAGCREGLVLQQGSQYLIMGPQEDRGNIDPRTHKFMYMLGEATWVERWPSPAECSSGPSLQAKCWSLQYELTAAACRL